MGELRLAVQEGVATEVDVGIVAESSRSRMGSDLGY